MSNSFNFLTGAGIGAGLMYLMDPDRGNRRRMLVRDQAAHGLHLGEVTAQDGEAVAPGSASICCKRTGHQPRGYWWAGLA